MLEDERPAWLQIGVAADLAKRYEADQREFFASLAALLEGALPNETQVERRGGLLSKKTLFRVTVTLDENRYALEDGSRGNLLATRTHIVRGIALKTEELPVAEWIGELIAAIEARARHSQAAREALSKFSEF
jgi:hypothetical protein